MGSRRVVFVVGSGRSGTSTMAGTLQTLGLHVPQPEVVADATNPKGFGANRLIGANGVVITAIPGGTADTGRVKVSGEEWAANGVNGMGVPVGTPVTISAVEGTRIVVQPTASHGLGPLGPS